MSYQNILYGDIKPFVFNSRDLLEDGEIESYFSEEFISNNLLNYFKDFNIGFHILVYNSDSIGVTFYLTTETTTDDKIQENLEKSVANIQTHIDKEDNELTIKWVGVKEEQRGKKYAKYLILLSVIYTKLVHDSIKKIMLDDDSDNYANGIEDAVKRRKAQSKNIYCRMGFKYEDESGGPEMEADIDEFIDKNNDVFLIKRKNTGESGTSKKIRSGSKKKKKNKRSYKKKRKSKKKKTLKKKKK